jgi:hypothetical protein
MATVTKSIGTSSRDYSTITLWEADLDDTLIYSSGDDAVGECYNDADFAEGPNINGGATVGLNSVTLTVADGEKHDGTAGTGVKVSGNYRISAGITLSNIVFTVSDIENNLTSANNFGLYGSARADVRFLRCIVHHSHPAHNQDISSILIFRRGSAMNNIVYGTLVNRDISTPIGIQVQSESGLGYYGYCYNNTIYNVTNTNASITTGGARGIFLNNVDLASHTIAKNNICVDTDTPNDPGFSSDIFFNDTASPAPYNLTSDDTGDDSTGDNTGALINKVSSGQFVSTVGGSEDLHLKSGADAIGAATDLAATPDGVQYDINGSNRNALAATVWDIGAHQYASTASIGTSSRDYSTITLWEADLDDTTVYGAGANAVGECYNDSTFDETVTIDGGTTVGLNSATLTVAAGERHDGTAGTGALLFKTSGGSPYYNIIINLNGVNRTLEWLEYQRTGTTFGAIGTISTTANTEGYIRNNICHNIDSATTGEPAIISLSNATTLIYTVTNNIVYACNHTANNATQMNGIRSLGVGPGSTIANNTVHAIGKTQGTGDCHGIANVNDDSDLSFKNNLSTDTTNSGTGAAKDYETTSLTNTDSATNMSSDATSPETGLRNVVTSDQFVSTVGGSEDLHLKSGSDAIGAGTDLGTTPDGVQYDIDGFDRDAANRVWDIGADQAAATITKTIGTTARDYSTITLWEADLDVATIYQSGDDAVGECYNDSTFDETVTIDGGITVGLNSVTLTAATGEKHDGTAGTGVQWSWTGGNLGTLCQLGLTTDSVTRIIEYIDFNGNNQNILTLVYHRNPNTGSCTTRYSLMRQLVGTNYNTPVTLADISNRNNYFYNNILYNCDTTGSNFRKTIGLNSNGAIAAQEIYNCTIHNIASQATNDIYGAYGYQSYSDATGEIVKNTIITSVNGNSPRSACFDFLSGASQPPSNAVYSHNISSDSSATGTGSLTNKTAANQFVSTVNGSEDLHLKAGSDAINAGLDLGTTPDGIQYDIDGDLRGNFGLSSIGADEFSALASRPDLVITRLGLMATPFKTFTVTDKGIVVEDANGKQFLMFVF